MQVEYGTVFSRVLGTPEDLWDVQQALIPPDLEEPLDSLLRPDGTLYTGLIPYLRSKLEGRDIEVLGDQGSPLMGSVPEVPEDLLATDLEPEFRLRDYQTAAIQKALRAGRGCIEIATGGGKTEVAAGLLVYLFWKRYIHRALYLVGTTHLLHQTVDRLQRRGVQDVGLLGDGQRRFGKAKVVVATVQSITKQLNWGDEQTHDLIRTADCLFADEVQHLSAKTWVAIAEASGASWRFGMTATLWDDPRGYTASDLTLIGLMGPPVVTVTMRALIARGFLAEPTILMPVLAGSKVMVHPRSWNAWTRTYRNGIVRHSERNSLVLSYARHLYDRGFKTLVFCSQVEHGGFLLACLQKLGIEAEALFLSGGSKAEFYVAGKKQTETWAIQKIAKYIETHDRCVVIGSPVMDEGVDFPGLSALIMAGAMQKYRRTVQRMGRGLRPKPGTNRVLIIDPFDLTHPFLQSHAEYRRWTYEAEGLKVLDDPAVMFGEPVAVNLGLVSGLGLAKCETKPRRLSCRGRRSYP